MVQCDLRCSQSKLRVTNAHGTLVYSTGKKLFEVKFNGMVSLMILNMIMIKVEQTVMMMLVMFMVMVMVMVMVKLMVMVMVKLIVMMMVMLEAVFFVRQSGSGTSGNFVHPGSLQRRG